MLPSEQPYTDELTVRLKLLRQHIENEVDAVLNEYGMQSVHIDVEVMSRMNEKGDEFRRCRVRIRASNEVIYSA